MTRLKHSKWVSKCEFANDVRGHEQPPFEHVSNAMSYDIHCNFFHSYTDTIGYQWLKAS